MTTAKTPSRLMTADELLDMERVPGKRFELIRGVLTEKEVATGDPHAATVLRAGSVVLHYTDATDYGDARAGEPGYKLESDPDTVRAPDVAWFAPGRIPPGTTGSPELTPDLCIEVASPSNSRRDRLLSDKAQMWLDFGAREVWVLNPENTSVARYRPGQPTLTLHEDDVLDGEELLPAFSVPVWQLFRRQR
ncbi:MAG: Uma2 family endonuclease [Chloroflexota bacterium]|nr:Uma2 family endonuclease [Chloroflexota bacterium]MDE2961919.1 Uma2 family endonuclease [Chloroflexota bacterium]